MAYDIEAIRRKLAESKGKRIDPDEFRPKKAENETPIKYRFFILPPFQQGEKIKGGPSSKGMDQFFLTHAQHWIQDRPHPCPRIYDGSECELCKTGFDLLKEKKGDEEAVKKIYKDWMPNQYYMVNIYFPEWVELNPDELKGKVKFYNAPKTCFDIFTNCLLKEDSNEEEPEANGVFFDENSAFLFELQVTKKGRSNNYAASKFLANNGQPQPMTKEGFPSLKEVLAQRSNLFDKIQKPDQKVIKKLAHSLLYGDVAEQEEAAESTSMKDKVEEVKQKRQEEARRKEEETEVVKKKPVAMDEDDAPVVKKKPVIVEDDDTPVAKKKPVIVEDDDAPPPKKKPVISDDEDEAPVVKKKPVITDDEDEAPQPKKKPVEEPKTKKEPKKVEEDDDDDITKLMKALEDDE